MAIRFLIAMSRTSDVPVEACMCVSSVDAFMVMSFLPAIIFTCRPLLLLVLEFQLWCLAFRSPASIVACCVQKAASKSISSMSEFRGL